MTCSCAARHLPYYGAAKIAHEKLRAKVTAQLKAIARKFAVALERLAAA